MINPLSSDFTAPSIALYPALRPSTKWFPTVRAAFFAISFLSILCSGTNFAMLFSLILIVLPLDVVKVFNSILNVASLFNLLGSFMSINFALITSPDEILMLGVSWISSIARIIIVFGGASVLNAVIAYTFIVCANVDVAINSDINIAQINFFI